MRHFCGFLAYIGVWICFCAVGEMAIKIESFGWVMVWGIVAYGCSDLARVIIIGKEEVKA